MKEGRVKLTVIKYGDRPAGWSYVGPPPDSYIGRIGIVKRELINSMIPCYWVEFLDGERFVIAEDELEQIYETPINNSKETEKAKP